MIFDPFLEVRNIICFDLGKLCFPLREIDFVTENSLPARGGVENSSEVVAFYRGHRGPTRNLAGEGFSRPPSPENREDPAILAWKSDGLSPKSDFKTARFRPIFGG